MKTKAKYLSILLGLFYCVFIFWNRFLRTRIPRDLFTEYSTLRIIIYICLFFISLFVALYHIKELLQIRSTNRLLDKFLNHPRVLHISEIFVIYILDAPKNLYEWLYERLKIRPYMDYFCILIRDNDFNDKYYTIRILVVCMSLIKIIVCLTFIHGVFYLHNFMYFFKTLILLAIPMFFSILLFMIHHLATKNHFYIETFMIFEPTEEDDGWIISRKDEDNKELTKEDMDYHAAVWFMYLYSIMTLENYYQIEKKVKPYIYLLCYSFYALGWGYILYRIILNEFF